MKESSVLIRRAALFTATVMAVTVAVSLCGYGIATWLQVRAAAKKQIIPQLEYLVSLAKGDAPGPLEDAAGVVAASGGVVWLQDGDWKTRCLTGEDRLPGIGEDIDNGALQPAEGYFRRDGRAWYYQDALISQELSHYQGRVAVAVPVPPVSWAQSAPVALLAALLGLVAARLTLRRQRKSDAQIRAKLDAIVRLRDDAVAMADGHLETRADETAAGELGELGKALNHLADQLSRNLYTLIVERNRLRNMLNGLSEGIVAINAEGRVTHTNPALGRLIARAKPGSHYADPRMKTIPDETIWQDFDKVMATGETMTRNLESKDMILRMTVTPIVDEIDAIAGAVGLFSDITQMERLEKTRRDYVSNVNHELRTPLTAMRALIEPLKEGMVTEEEDRQRYYDIILREIMRLSRLINDQLELSRLQSGTLSIEKSRLALDDLVYDVCDRYAAIAEEHNLKLNVDTDFSACPAVWANADRVEQMLIILLDNAIKYTEEGSVGVSATWDEDKVVLTVRDTGIGIEENDLPYVFDRFYKVDKAHSGKGSGLGLSIAKELLKRMDEDIWVESEKGKGTAFSFTIHRNPPKEAADSAE